MERTPDQFEAWLPSDGNGRPPRTLPCFECQTPMRRRPGNRYHCPICDSDTTIEVLEVSPHGPA